MECWFNGRLQLNKGDIVEIVKAFFDESSGWGLRVSVVKNVTRGWEETSRDEGIIMSISSSYPTTPVQGRVIESRIGSNEVTYFSIEKGIINQDNIFVKYGDFKIGQQAHRYFCKQIEYLR